MKLKDLTKGIDYKWRVQGFSKYKPQATCVAYIDARDCMDLLDEVCGPENWQVRYKEINGKLFAEVGINAEYMDDKIKHRMWIWKSDTGSESNIEKDKGLVSDAFKRACVHWGVGRFLYSLKVKYVDANEEKTDRNKPHPINKSGQRIWDLTEHFKREPPKIPHKEGDYLPKEGESTEMVIQPMPKKILKPEQYKAMIDTLAKGKYAEVEERMKFYDLTLHEQDNLENAIKECKSFSN